MGNWHVHLHWSLDQDFVELRHQEDQGIKLRKKLRGLLQVYLSLSVISDSHQVLCLLFSSIIFGILYSINEQNIGYVSLNGSIATNVLYTWGSWFISFSNFIPISLIVTIETVRYGQGMILNKD